MKTDKTFEYDKMMGELALLIESLNIANAKDSLTYLLIDYCKHLNDVPAYFSTMIEDAEAILELLSIIQRHEVIE